MIRQPARSARTSGREPIFNNVPAVVLWLLVANLAVEFILQLSQWQVGFPTLRNRVYEYGAFWSILLHGSHPVFPLQPVTMFFTYAFLHGGLLHLGVNMIALLSFGRAIVRKAGTLRFLVAYFLTSVAGAACYGLLVKNPAPMVGASGALFGLAGLWICWNWLNLRSRGQSTRAIRRVLIYLVAYNVVFYFLLRGHLAWETHLGGFVAGWVLGLLWGIPAKRRA
ncbi:rhomboid family intramembrane serine protease [Qingshengfaniella alkalisoli]|uniref:Rhomboid family intramembrane serine protease n=1 Tax=Qingshengfaniella alkalisoli TaxID=2599296 RepID=A0A5B8J606_9RHOB|nr:rhomboid family intramembrane serine protease [Qingshengfaniella alkalisoli]QDY69770.1 rhomboid family intramembrane serine protease [Qingshengfaniella alkalisoli]